MRYHRDLGFAIKVVASLALIHGSIALCYRVLHLRVEAEKRKTIDNDAKEILATIYAASSDEVVNADGEGMLRIQVNTHELVAEVVVHCSTVDLEGLSMLYFSACIGHASPPLVVDLWNVLCAIIEHELSNEKSVTKLNKEELAKLLAIAHLMAHQYAVEKHVSANTLHGLRVLALRRDLAKEGLKSFDESTLGFATSLLHYTSKDIHPIKVAFLLLCNNTVLRFLRSSRENMSTLLLAEASQCSSEIDGSTPFSEFLRKVFDSKAGRMVAGSSFFKIAEFSLTTLETFVSSRIMTRVNYSVEAHAYHCVSVQDYVPEDWTLPTTIQEAVEDCGGYALYGVSRLSQFAVDLIRNAATFFSYPIHCTVAWLSQTYIHHIESLLFSLVPLYENTWREKRERHHRQKNVGGVVVESEEECSAGMFGLSLLALTQRELECAPAPCALMLLTFDMVFVYEQQAFLQAVSLPLLQQVRLYVDSHYDGEDQEGVAQFFKTVEDDLKASADVFPNDVQYQMTEDLFYLMQRSGFSVLLTDSSEKKADEFFSFRCKKEAIQQLADRAHLLPLSLAFSVGQSFTSNVLKGESLTDAADVCDNISCFATEFMQGFAPYSPYNARNIVEYQLKLQERSGFSFGKNVSILQELDTKRPLIDCKSWEECAALPTVPWSIEFRHVFFSYPGARQMTLKDVSFKLEAGQQLGVIGYSGAGKSTLLLLINRIYAPTKGEILINGLPIQSYPARAYSRRVAYAWQDVDRSAFLDSVDIQSNIALGNLHRSAESTRQSLEVADSWKVVSQRDGGVHARLDAKKFSGGEVERLNIARAVHRGVDHTSLIMFDECMSALDSVTEEAIRTSLARIWSGYPVPPTLVLVSHRLASVKDCDYIIVVADGEVREKGSWSQLVADSTNKNFHTLLSSQRLMLELSTGE